MNGEDEEVGGRGGGRGKEEEGRSRKITRTGGIKGDAGGEERATPRLRLESLR